MSMFKSHPSGLSLALPFARLSALLVGLCLLAGCITDISVTRHPSVAMSDAEAEAILADFSAVVNTADSPTDYACITSPNDDYVPAFYIIDGNVGTHNGPSVVNSQADLTAVLNEPGYAKVVSAINWCGDFGPNIIGCAPIPGDSFAVVRPASAIEGILWAHEFGHTVGLSHRPDSTAVMKDTINANNRDITLAECAQYIQKVNPDYGNPAASSAALRTSTTSAVDGLRSSHVTTSTSASLLEFVRKVYPHGTPMSELASFDAGGDLPALRAMMWAEAEAHYWGNIAVALGMLGDASDVSALVEFANQQSQRGSDAPQSVGNASAALMALGYLANRTGDSTAIEYLEAAQNASRWSGSSDKQTQLVTAAYIGMAFSGQAPPVATTSLSRSSRSAGVVSNGLLQALDTVTAEIASKGVRRYYQER
ncbi:MAG: hypothetical protein AB8C02_13320 [Halioglobus sp.]